MMQCDALKNFNPLVDSSQLSQLSASYEISYALQRMAKNMALINAGVNAQQITATNTNLFRIAVEYYQDAALWSYIAQVNGITDFEITSPTVLNIPPKPPLSAGFGT